MPTRRVRLPGSLTGRRAPIDVEYVHWCAETCFHLTPADRQIVEHLARGKTNRRIGESVGLAQQSVKNRLSVIMRKLGVHSRTELVRLAIKSGIE